MPKGRPSTGSGSADDIHTLTFFKVIVTEESAQVLDAVVSVLPRFRQLIAAKITEEDEAWIMKVLTDWMDLCALNKNNDHSNPHTINQNILYNAGAVGECSPFRP